MTLPTEPTDSYPPPAVYDILNSPGTHTEMATLSRILRSQATRPAPDTPLWFEPACGTGRYLRLAARRGCRVAGFDHDPQMLAYAQACRGMKEAVLFPGEMANFLPASKRAGLTEQSVDLALNPVNTIRHLQTDQELINHLNQMAVLLKPDGLYIVGLSLVDYSWLYPEEDLWESTRGRCKVSQLVNYLPPEPHTLPARTETVISHLTITTPSRTTHLDQRYLLRTYDETQWQRVVELSHLRRVAIYDAKGNVRGKRNLPYQLEVLALDPR